MYSKQGTIIDRREMLKIKLKSLAVEAQIIRHQELRTHGALREEMHIHRVKAVRSEARHTHLAYGLIRGRTIDQIEPKRKTEPDMARVNKMLLKYGAVIAVPKPQAVAA